MRSEVTVVVAEDVTRRTGASEWLTTGEAAMIIGLSKSTVIRLIEAGQLLAVRPNNTWRRVSREDVLLYQREHDPDLPVSEREAARLVREELHARVRETGNGDSP